MHLRWQHLFEKVVQTSIKVIHTTIFIKFVVRYQGAEYIAYNYDIRFTTDANTHRYVYIITPLKERIPYLCEHLQIDSVQKTDRTSFEIDKDTTGHRCSTSK
jgi:hypothetical protein